MIERSYTDFLAPDSTFLMGAGSVFSLSGSNFFYNRSATRELADARAIHQDFVMVGEDISVVINRIEKEMRQQMALPL